MLLCNISVLIRPKNRLKVFGLVFVKYIMKKTHTYEKVHYKDLCCGNVRINDRFYNKLLSRVS
jgi:hypothetical protein